MTLQELLDECRNNINSEVVFQEIVKDHDKQIIAEVIEEYNKSLKEHWIEEDDLGLSDVFFKYVDKIAEKLKENK